ncbi:hypothetical protein [Shimia sagamensis]|uniref:Copper chaperone PCu(A)C n=1 Tax=Shimia sagamensis TaxID=1566352 RepID=A0ABY1P536_9RHOB|nr:hypothetical protein [Shimia sagamensis]SMP25769.1 hypothetical protein SAMN06265373_105153 [Shimia sagamensis]
MTDTKLTFTRRSVLATLLMAPVGALAHSGHGMGHLTVTTTVTRRRKHRLDLVLTFYNAGTAAMTLEALSTDVAQLSGLKLPFEIPAGGLEEQKLTLRFDDAVPGIFTLLLDFGEDGQGPVTVMP